MSRSSTLRFAAALIAFLATGVPALPAAAQAAPAPRATESAYAAVLHTINPKLTVERARSYARSVMADAWRTHLDPRFIMSIVTVESRWRANAVSHSGARGLGQLMPSTAARLGVNAWNPSENLRGTSNYLKTLMNHFAGKPNAVKLAIAGYNAGPKAVERYHGVPPYTETRNYVVRVLRVWNQINGRVGKAFAPPRVDATIAVRAPRLPDERQWLTNVNDVLPATAAAVEAIPNPALSAAVSVDDETPAITVAVPDPAK